MTTDSTGNDREDSHAAPNEDRLVQAMEHYLELMEQGSAPPIKEFVALYPDHSNELAECLEGLRLVNRAQPDMSLSCSITPMPKGVSLLGDFQLLKEIGRGGMGVVYRAKQMSLDREVAVKVLPFASAFDAQRLQRFKNEARATATLKHPHIVNVLSVGCERGIHYFAMELVEGSDIGTIISGQRTDCQNGAPTKDTVPIAAVTTAVDSSAPQRYRAVASLGADVANALQHAHQAGVIHRDIKPSNLLIDHDGRVHVTDFGLALIQGNGGLTMTGDVVGTLRYMSPEQLQDGNAVDHRADIYGLGLTLFELLCFESAFPEDDRGKLIRDILDKRPSGLRSIDRNIPRDLETIVLKAIEKHPSDRYQQAVDLAEDLNCFLEHRPIKAKRRSTLTTTWQWCVRNPALSAITTAFVLFLVLGLANAQRQLGSVSAAKAEQSKTLYSSLMQLAYEAWNLGDSRVASDRLEAAVENLKQHERNLEWKLLSRSVGRIEQRRLEDQMRRLCEPPSLRSS